MVTLIIDNINVIKFKLYIDRNILKGLRIVHLQKKINNKVKNCKLIINMNFSTCILFTFNIIGDTVTICDKH
jgi:hypothetical protein